MNHKTISLKPELCALARFGGGVSELRGSIAGNVFSRSRAGAIVRNRAVPVNPNTTLQSEVRGRMQMVTDGFKELTKDEVDAWSEFAATQERINRLGEVYVPSGKQLFTEASMNLMNLTPDAASLASLSAVQSDPNLPGLNSFTVTITIVAPAITVLTLNLSGTSENATNLIVQATAPMLQTIRNAKKYFRQLSIPGVGGTVALIGAYTAQYPDVVADAAPYEGRVIHFRVKALNSANGLAGEWIYGSVEIPAAV